MAKYMALMREGSDKTLIHILCVLAAYQDRQTLSPLSVHDNLASAKMAACADCERRWPALKTGGCGGCEMRDFSPDREVRYIADFVEEERASWVSTLLIVSSETMCGYAILSADVETAADAAREYGLSLESHGERWTMTIPC